MINAIILAAGESKRMGKPKPLLKFNDRTFLEQIISVLEATSVGRITVVLGANADIVRESCDLSEVNVVINENWQKGQLSSLNAAIDEVPNEINAILVCLVDHPFITEDVINKIISHFKKTNDPIIVPVFNKKRGHPALFSRSLFNELRNAPEEHGARYVLHSNEDKIFSIETSESGIVISIDNPVDYERHFGVKP